MGASVIGDHVDLQRGTTYKSMQLGQPGPVLLGLASIERNGGFRRGSLETYGGESPARLLLRPGDLYVSLKDVTQSADLLGAVARVPEDVVVGRLTQDTVRLVVKRDAPGPSFLYWWLRTPPYRRYCRARSIGTTNLSLARGDFLGYPVPEPTADQLELVRLLDHVESKIDLNRRLAGTLLSLGEVAFRRLIEPLPQERTLDEIADLNARAVNATYRPTEIEYLDIASISKGELLGTTPYARSAAPGRARRLTADGDTLWSVVRPNRRSYWYVQDPPANLVVSTGIAVLTPRGVPGSFLYYTTTTREFVDHLTSFADGSAYPAVRPEAFQVARVRVPGQAELTRFDRLASPLLRRRSRVYRETRVLAGLRDLLLVRLAGDAPDIEVTGSDADGT